jgi:hypothetical protein
MNWPLLLGAVLLLAACDRRSSLRGKGSGSKAQSSDHAQAAQQDIGNSASAAAARSSSPGPTKGELLSSQSSESDSEESRFPPHGSPLSPEEAHRLLSGTVIFNPKSIPSSDRAIEPDTPLEVGQDLQVKYGGTWWSGTILAFEPDGRVRIHYYGWADSWDEPKTRAELQWDVDARVHALDSTYVREGW